MKRTLKKYISLKNILFLFLVLNFESCKKTTTRSYQFKQITVNDSILPNKEIENFIAPFKNHINKDLDSTLSYNPKTLSKTNGSLNTAIGNLMADATYIKANTIFNKRTGKNIDFVLLNFGGIRAIIPKGNITTRNAFEVMPFENSVVVVALNYKQIKSLVNYLLKAKKAHPISNQLQILVSTDDTLKSVKLNKKDLEVDKIYYVATSDYLFEGGDQMNFFSENEGVYNLDYKIRNILIDYFKDTDTLKASIDDRFIKIN